MANDDPMASLFLSPEPLTPAWYGEDASDAILLDRFIEQWDQAAFRDLVGRHGPMVLGVCRRILRDPHAAEDAFQATFLLLARKAGSVRKRGSIGPWLYGVAQRVALEARGTTARRPVPTPLDLEVPGVDDHDGLERDELHAALHAQTLGFVHPFTGQEVRVESPLPADLSALIVDLRNRYGIPGAGG